MDKNLLDALVAEMPSPPASMDTYDIWPNAFLSKQNRKRKEVREHNLRYEEARNNEPVVADASFFLDRSSEILRGFYEGR